MLDLFMQDIRIVSFNVNGLLNPIKRKKILTKLKKDKVNIALLQETHLTVSEHAKLNKLGFKYVYSSSYKSGHRRGVAILLSSALVYEHMAEFIDKEGRYAMITGKIDGSLVSLLNVYAPPACDWAFYRQVFELMTVKAQGILICGGDFNVRLNPKMDASSGNPVPKPISKKLKGLMSETGIVDVWREMYPTSRDYTHYSSPHALYSRIDYFFVFNWDLHRVNQCDIGPIALSDHSPIYINVCLDRKPKATLWRLNPSILNRPETCEGLKVDIRTYLEQNDNSEVTPTILWDAMKAVMRGKIIATTSLLNKIRKKRLHDLETQLKQLQRIHSSNLDTRTKQEIRGIRNEIDEISTQEIQKKMLFTKQRYYETGGKSMKLLAYKLKKQQADNTIYKIRDPLSGAIECRIDKIQNSFEKFYKTLYSQPHIDNSLQIDPFLASLDLPSVTEEQNDQLTAEITKEELDHAISKLKVNKSPGTDGFNSEWYKVLRKQLAPTLLRACNWVLQKQEIPPSWREAIISVIPKDGKDKTECKNYRPISVLNVDYKLFTSIIARRIEKILPQLIHLDQTGFIRQRQTQDNIRRTLHIINHITQQKLDSVLVSLDAEKAFDSVRWSFLYKVLTKFGFHNSIIAIFQTLYDKPSARIKINGDLSDSFLLERGTRQGCPASPLLFALFLEPLSQWIRQNDDVKGVTIGGQEHKLAAFADDVLLYLTRPSESLPKLMEALDKYGALSGYKLNIQKTQVMTFNYHPPGYIKEKYQLNWSADRIKYLGVIIPKDVVQLGGLNYGPLNQEIKSDIHRWSLIPFLSLSSRVESIKMNILPRLLYLFQTLPVELPIKQFTDWDRLISRYLWRGGRPRIRYKTLQLRKGDGGLSLPCLQDYYYAAQMRPLVCWCSTSYTARWMEIESMIIGDIPVAAVIADNKLICSIIKKNNSWINVVLNIWQSVLKLGNLENSLRMLKWCAYDTDFIPNKSDSRFKLWVEKGLTTYSSFVHKGAFNSFESLQKEHGLHQSDFYRYLQVRHYFNQSVGGTLELGEASDLTRVFLLANSSGACNKAVSKLYNGLLQLKANNTLYIKEKWEKEGNLVLNVEEWSRICRAQWAMTSSTSWREFSWKNLVRFFITPLQKRHLGQGTACWRLCGSNEAHHFHIFWDCPTLTPFWQMIHKHLEAIFDVTIPFVFSMLFMGNFQFEGWNWADRKMMMILMVASKKSITRKWLKPDPPTEEDWLDVLYDIYKMEKITFSIRLQSEKFVRIWNKWFAYVKPIRSDFVEGLGVC